MEILTLRKSEKSKEFLTAIVRDDKIIFRVFVSMKDNIPVLFSSTRIKPNDKLIKSFLSSAEVRKLNEELSNFDMFEVKEGYRWYTDSVLNLIEEMSIAVENNFDNIESVLFICDSKTTKTDIGNIVGDYHSMIVINNAFSSGVLIKLYVEKDSIEKCKTLLALNGLQETEIVTNKISN